MTNREILDFWYSYCSNHDVNACQTCVYAFTPKCDEIYQKGKELALQEQYQEQYREDDDLEWWQK